MSGAGITEGVVQQAALDCFCPLAAPPCSVERDVWRTVNAVVIT
jgi:hypothetical protein